MALYRTYEPKALVLVDSMDQGFGQPNDSSDLAIFEFKRQCIFHILQTIENAYFYRVEFRPSIPEYFC